MKFKEESFFIVREVVGNFFFFFLGERVGSHGVERTTVED